MKEKRSKCWDARSNDDGEDLVSVPNEQLNRDPREIAPGTKLGKLRCLDGCAYTSEHPHTHEESKTNLLSRGELEIPNYHDGHDGQYEIDSGQIS